MVLLLDEKWLVSFKVTPPHHLCLQNFVNEFWIRAAHSLDTVLRLPDHCAVCINSEKMHNSSAPHLKQESGELSNEPTSKNCPGNIYFWTCKYSMPAKRKEDLTLLEYINVWKGK